MHISYKAFHVSGMAAIMLAAPGVAHAQASPSVAEPEPAATAGTGEIIVTAQRRSERLTDVPIAIVAQSAEQLARAGATNVRDLSQVTPGLRMSGNGLNSQPSIRGIHSDQTDPGNDPNVSLYIDGVYQANQIANNADLADIERVEVLKGPQGTLFGRNATGGAIRVFTRQPSFTPGGMLDLSYGRFDDVTVKGYLTAPIVKDKIAASLSGFYERADAFTYDIVARARPKGLRSRALRGKLLLQPTDALSITLMGAYTYRFDTNTSSYTPINGNTVGRTVPGTIIPNRDYEFTTSFPAFGRSRVYTGAVKVDYETSAGTLTSTTAYNDVKARYAVDSDFTRQEAFIYDLHELQRDISEELIFSSEQFGIAQITAGLFYYHSAGRYNPLTTIAGPLAIGGPYAVDGVSRQQTDAYAGFGELALEPSDHINIILGARYSHERRKAVSNFYGALFPDCITTLCPIGPGSASFNSLTPRASIRYSFDSGDNLYFTYSRGFKSGGFNISGGGPTTTPFRPETLDAFEIGLKTATNRFISANLSTFYYKYKDQQVSANVNGRNDTFNAASSEIYGMDADIVIRPSREFSVQSGISWLHARFNKFDNATINIRNPSCAPQPCGNITQFGADLSVGREPYSPDFTINVTPTYRKEIYAGVIELSGSYYHSSKYFFDNNARVGQKAFDLFSARASFAPAGTNLSIYAWGKNLSNERSIATVFLSNDGDGATYIAPRTYGIGARYQF